MGRLKKISLSVLLIVSTQVFASNVFQFENYTTSEGLSHKTITCFMQDKNEFLWIGTTNGLNRFNGYNFDNYYHKTNDPQSLPSNSINKLQEDQQGKIWIISGSELCIYDPLTEAFRKINTARTKPNYAIISFCIDNSSQLWAIDNDNSLLRFNTDNDSIIKKFRIDSIIKDTGKLRIWDIAYINSQLWLISSIGPIKLDPQSLTAELKEIEGTSNYVHHIKQGRQGSIIFVMPNDGIYIEANNGTGSMFYPFESFEGNSFNMLHMSDASYDGQGNLWVSGNPGLFKISPDRTITRISKKNSIYFDFDKYETNLLFLDKNSNLWAGGMNDGIFVLPNNRTLFQHYSLKHKNLMEMHVRSSLEIDNKVFMGNLHGTYMMDLSKPGKENLSKLREEPTLSICKYSDDTIAIASNIKVYLYSISTNSFVNQIKSEIYINKCFVDSRKIIWTTHWANGMVGHDIKNNRTIDIDIAPDLINKNTIYRISEDADGSFWVGSFGAGLVHIINPAGPKPQIIRYNHKLDDSTGASSNIILSMYDDNNGNIWLGTNGDGLSLFNKKSHRFKTYTMADGLKSNVIEAINGDNEGNIWFVSSVVSKFNIKTNTFMHFDKSDGIQSRYFTGTSFRDNKGNLYFGDDHGLLIFNPLLITNKEKPKIPQLTSFKLFGQSIIPGQKINGEVPLTNSLNYTDKLELAYNFNSFTIEFASIQIPYNQTIRYTYILEGAEKKWSSTQLNEHSVTYSALPPGNYRFKVKSSKGTENWNQGRELEIIILPPWWDTLLFKILLYSSIALLAAAIVARRILRTKKEKEQLEKLVSERTEDLRISNDQLEQQSLMLEEQNEALENSKLIIEINNQELSDTLDLKNKLIGIISHDFKNALNVLLNNIKAIGMKTPVDKLNYSEDEIHMVHDLLKAANKSAKKLSDQMGGVLDWAQGHLNKVKSKPAEVNLESILADAIQLYYESLRQKNISISTQLDYSHNAWADPRMIATVFRNILLNAIKFTPHGGNIIITLNEEDTLFEITFTDTGTGIEPEKLEQLFASYNPENIAAGTQGEKGIGLGLQICKSFIKSNNGTISASSQLGEGSSFSITLPKGKTKANKNFSKVHEPIVKEEPALTKDNSKTILIVDDNVELIQFLSNSFASRFNVIKATDGKLGYQLAQKMLPNIIVSDIKMPRMNGFELCKAIRANKLTSHIPVILLSAEKREVVEYDCYLSGASDYIEKPFDDKVLHHKVDAYLKHSVHKQMETPTQAPKVELPESPDEEFLQKLNDYISENLSDPDFDVDAIASEVGFSRTQLWRKTKNLTEKSPSELLKVARMEKAAIMLKTGKYRISDIAYHVGYNNPKVFNKNFSSIYKMTPSKFMKQEQENSGSAAHED